MTQREWGETRIALLTIAVTIPPIPSEVLENQVSKLDKHFDGLMKLTPVAKGVSSGRPKKHIDLSELVRLQKQRMSLREMGKCLNVSRETIRRLLKTL